MHNQGLACSSNPASGRRRSAERLPDSISLPWSTTAPGPTMRLFRTPGPTKTSASEPLNRSTRFSMNALSSGTPASAASRVAPVNPSLLLNNIPGFALALPGPANGPLTSASSKLLFGATNSELALHLLAGDLTGYVRAWTSILPRGDVIVVGVFRFASPIDASDFLLGAENSLTRAERQLHGSLLVLTNVHGGFGVQWTQRIGGVSETFNGAFFATEDGLFYVATYSPRNDLSELMLNELAGRQAAQAKSSGLGSGLVVPFNSSATFRRDGQIVGEAVLILFGLSGLVYLLTRRRWL